METLANLMFEGLNDKIDNLLYFICCAYEANFHFTAFENKCHEIRRNHWMKALELCHEGLSELASAKETFAHWIYPSRLQLMVTATKEFSDIFDEYINSAVNISTPLHDEFESSEFSVHFSSADFLRYVRIQCMRKLKVNFNEDEEIFKMEEAEYWTPTRMLLCHALRLRSEQDQDRHHAN